MRTQRWETRIIPSTVTAILNFPLGATVPARSSPATNTRLHTPKTRPKQVGGPPTTKPQVNGTHRAFDAEGHLSR